MSFESGGEGPEEAGGHGQEVALHTKESDEVLDDLENLIEDQHSVEPVESGGVEVEDLSCQASQASERRHEVSRLHCMYKFSNSLEMGQPSSSRTKQKLTGLD